MGDIGSKVTDLVGGWGVGGLLGIANETPAFLLTVGEVVGVVVGVMVVLLLFGTLVLAVFLGTDGDSTLSAFSGGFLFLIKVIKPRIEILVL